MYMGNHDSHNCLYFMLGATMTALGCMSYCMCKNNGYLDKMSCNDSNDGNGKRMLKMTGKRHLGHKCHHGHHRHGEHQEYEGYQMPEDEQQNSSK